MLLKRFRKASARCLWGCNGRRVKCLFTDELSQRQAERIWRFSCMELGELGTRLVVGSCSATSLREKAPIAQLTKLCACGEGVTVVELP